MTLYQLRTGGSLSNCLVIKESSATLKLDVGVIKIHLSLPLLLFYNQLLYDIVTPINPSIAAAAVPCHKVLKNSNCPKFPSTVSSRCTRATGAWSVTDTPPNCKKVEHDKVCRKTYTGK